ncbi:MAG: NAD(P)-dependent oxidoreductase [Spirochaetota bacterium]
MTTQSTPRIRVLDAMTLGDDVSLAPLEELGSLTVHELTSPDDVGARLAEAEVVVTNKVALMRAALEQAGALRLVALTATGTNNVDLEACRELGVAVANVSGYSTESVAQHTLALALQLFGRTPYYQRYVADGEYRDSPIFTHYGPRWHELASSRWGIVGMGSIGRRVADLATAFGARVVYHSTSGRSSYAAHEHLPLDELLSTSDVVTIHCPLTPDTRGLIGERELALMKREAVLVNVARGGIVDEQALASAIRAERIGGAATDVFVDEPLSDDSPLLAVLGSDRFIATPHSAWLSVEARTRLVSEVAGNVAAFLRGEDRNRVV